MNVPMFASQGARTFVRSLVAGGLALGLVLGGARDAAAQATGTVTGRVTDAATQAPMGSTQVFLVGTGLGTLTSQNGRFIILNVPAGTHTLRVERIGFTTIDRQVTVGAGQSVTEDFQLATEPLGLDEIVVTGTAGAARRREVGNSISQVDLSDVKQPAQNVDALLQGRITGATISPSSGGIGGGSQIRLRGNVSVAMSNQPILYVDGVRVRSDGFAKNVPASGSQLRSNNDISSPLNSIDPADIERIEVIKGSAATTLYGTEAAAGVIQIFTKRGHTGQAQWTAQVETGVARNWAFGPDLSNGVPQSEAGVDGNGMIESGGTPEFMYIDPWLRGNLPSCDIATLKPNQPCDSGLFSDWGALQQRYSLSVSGGGEALRYFMSGSWDNDEGVLPLDKEKKFTVRGNFTFNPIENLQLQWNTSYTNDDLTQTPAGNNAQGITLNSFRRDRNYANDDDFDVVNTIVRNADGSPAQSITTQIDHMITGLTATYTPRTGFSNRLTVGYDLAQQDNRNLRPFGYPQQPAGVLNNGRFEFSNLTFDYVGSLDFHLTEAVRSSFSWGGQSVATERLETQAYGENFPGPGEPDVDAAGTTLGFEERIRVVNAGFFVQNLFDISNKYFITAGLRVDGNSAFGQDLGLQAYPKVSASWVVSDEDFWSDDLGQLKLRAAWGQSGRAPGAFDAVRTYDPVGWGGNPAFFPNNVGNSELGPERTTELEMGFDASVWDSRLSIEYTYYNQLTTDALFDVRQIPSLGFLSSQLQNVGELKNTGHELAINATVLQRESFQWDLGTSVFTNKGEVSSLPSDVPSFSLGNFGWVAQGQPVPVIQPNYCVTNPDEIAAPIIENPVERCSLGPNLPTLTLGGNTTLYLPAGLTFTVRGEYQGGHYISNGAASAALSRSVRWPGCFEAYRLEETGGINTVPAKLRAMCFESPFRSDYTIDKADFFKLREVTLSVPVPDRFLFGGAQSANLTLSGRNVWRWVNSDWNTLDPEMGNNDGFDSAVRSLLEHIPAPAYYTAALRLTF
ncbi:MAG: SusC/RagA family TonB-linked outer membrane protein [Gemmatimonadota bacterium]|nr:SusC/RagA family TonB-linked outer membrane protein [Gemmatimonadota bacterium]